MLNYIWAGLIVFSLVFALASDVRDLYKDTYRNDAQLSVRLHYTEGLQPGARRVPVDILIDPAAFRQFYGTDVTPDSVYSGYVIRTQRGNQLRFAADAALPEPLATIRGFSASNEDELQGRLGPEQVEGGTLVSATTVRFAPVQFVKLKAITQAAFDFAETAVTLALGLIGVIALWLGLLRIAEASRLTETMVRFTEPILRPLFPKIPKGHPAMALIALNLTANMLGLGNAATPLGIKAMESLQELNPSEDTATNPMVMLLAMNTASVQLVPPTLLVAIMGLQVNELIFPIIVVTLISLTIAIVSTKLLGRLAAFRRSDPDRQPAG